MNWDPAKLGSPVVPFCPFSFWAPFLKKTNNRKKGILIIKGLLGNLEKRLGRRMRMKH